MNAEYDTHLQIIFERAEQRMWNLSRGENACFTNYEFIRRTTQDHQPDYIRLLSAVLTQTSEQRPFGTAHSLIGDRLGELAKALGYAQDKNPDDIQEHNIWGEKVKPIVYRRTERVRQPN